MSPTAHGPAQGPTQRTSPTFVGMPAFPEAARTALANTQQRRNLRHATSTIRAKRAAVVGELPQWEALRVAGAQAKDEALTHLGDYLEQLEASLTANGATVHWARDADEANRIVVDLVRAKQAEEVVKVKSMVTQEIELNEALEAAGVHAWETDLAELIVQLGHDRPSHILVPAIHRNRSEIRDIFRREMAQVGRPAPDDLTDEPARLAEAARLHLREKFLRARVAVSGANFAIADTGTLVVVESEGNGRMCLTLPETLISVVGIEKVLPTWDDLGTMLQLLPRSSTGERMNPYTTMWSGVHEGDGPQEVHVVLLDNGRSHVLADRLGRQALRCIRCSACLNVCPVYERTGGHAYGSVYPGPIGAVLNPQLRGTASEVDASLPYASSLCGACFDACPVRINIPELLVELRGTVAQQGGPPGRVRGDEGSGLGAVRPPAPRRGPEGRHDSRVAHRGPDDPVCSRPGRLDQRPRPADPTDGDVPAVVGPRARHSRTRSGARRGRCRRRAGHRRARHRRGGPMSARDEILARVRNAVADVTTGTGTYAAAPVPGAASPGVVETLDLFAENVADYRATVVRVDEAGVAAAVADALHGAGARSVVVPGGLDPGWLGAVEDGVARLAEAEVGPATELDAVDAVVTAAAVGIATTGTIVLDHRADQGRRELSLVPDVHVCVVRAEQVVHDVPEAVARLRPGAGGPRPLTWISGPSATSDIELQRVEGVHGPRTLVVVLVAAG